MTYIKSGQLKQLNYKMRVLITCFGAFQNFNENPSKITMNHLKKITSSLKNIIFEWEEIEVIFEKVDEFTEHLNHDHDLIIHLGVATGAEKLKFELCAHNIKNGVDTIGVDFKNTPIQLGANKIETSFPIEVIKNFVEEHKNETEISKDAGAYLCNYVYFKSLLKTNEKSKVIFIHIADYQNNQKAKNAEDQSELIYQFLIQILNHSIKEK